MSLSHGKHYITYLSLQWHIITWQCYSLWFRDNETIEKWTALCLDWWHSADDSLWLWSWLSDRIFRASHFSTIWDSPFPMTAVLVTANPTVGQRRAADRHMLPLWHVSPAASFYLPSMSFTGCNVLRVIISHAIPPVPYPTVQAPQLTSPSLASY